MPGFFITGTDTGVGKTFITAGLLMAARDQGLRAVGMKPVAAGFEPCAGGWCNEDVAALQAAAGVEVPADLVNPYGLRAAIAPHIAAAQEGRRIEVSVILEAYAELKRRADWVLVEGVGGFCVPLNETADTADLALALGLPLILVVGMRLGCLNHALLTAEAIRARGLSLAGWIANRIDPAMAAYDENREALVRRLQAPLLAEVPNLGMYDPGLVAGYLGRALTHLRAPG